MLTVRCGVRGNQLVYRNSLVLDRQRCSWSLQLLMDNCIQEALMHNDGVLSMQVTEVELTRPCNKIEEPLKSMALSLYWALEYLFLAFQTRLSINFPKLLVLTCTFYEIPHLHFYGRSGMCRWRCAEIGFVVFLSC